MSSSFDSLLSATSLVAIAKEFISAGIPNNYNPPCSPLGHVEHLQHFLDSFDNKIKLVGSAAELCEHLETYRHFPVHHYCAFSVCDSYSGYISVYETVKSRKLTRKGTFYTLLQNKALTKFKLLNNILARAMIACFLKHDELEYTDWHNFIMTPEELRSWVIESVDRLWEEVQKDIQEKRVEPLKHSEWTELTQKVGEILPMCANPPFDEIYVVLSDVIRTTPSLENKTFYDEMFHVVRKIVKFFRQALERFESIIADGSFIVYQDKERRFLMNEWWFPNYLPQRFLGTTPEDQLSSILEKHPTRPWDVVILSIQRTGLVAHPILTRSGEFCKLASDVLMELLRNLIFGYRIFQKIKKQDVVYYFENLKPFFDLERKSPYFLTEKQYRCLLSTTESYFSEYLNRPAKEFRNLKQKFTPEVLKKELVFLGFTEVFPDITKHVKRTHQNSMSGRNEKDMKTSDLVQAVGNCVAKSLWERIPDLYQFFHVQDGGDLLANSKPRLSRTRFNNTSWKDILIAEVSSTRLRARCDPVMTIGDKERRMMVFSNQAACFDFLRFHRLYYEQFGPEKAGTLLKTIEEKWKQWKPKVFLVDYMEVQCRQNKAVHQQDRDRLETALDCFQECQSLEVFCLVNKPKNLYLRTFSNSVLNSADDPEIAKHQKKWPQGCNVTLNLKELEQLLKEFDVNKELLTLIPDIRYAYYVTRGLKITPGCPIISIFSPSRELVMEISQAHFHIFQSVVCDVEWRKEVCQEPENSRKMFRKAIIDEMKALGDGLVLKEDVEKAIERLKQHPNYLERKEKKLLTPLIKLHDGHFDDSITFNFFFSECKSHGIECYQQSDEAMEEEMPVWKARLLFLHFWIPMFFNGFETGLEQNVRKALLHKVPIKDWTHESDFMDVILDQNEKMYLHIQNDLSAKAMSKILYSDVDEHYHPWLKNESFRSRSFINRSETWNIREDRTKLVHNVQNGNYKINLKAKANGRTFEDGMTDMLILKKMIGGSVVYSECDWRPFPSGELEVVLD